MHDKHQATSVLPRLSEVELTTPKELEQIKEINNKLDGLINDVRYPAKSAESL